MRLTSEEVAAIKAAAEEAFGTDTTIRLFGSRLDNGRRGGDIDLLVQLPDAATATALGCFRRLLEQRVGEREYDILVTIGDRPTSPVARRALAEGIVL